MPKLAQHPPDGRGDRDRDRPANPPR